MKMILKTTINLLIFLFSFNASAEKCLNDQDFEQILTALKELKEIRESKAQVTISEPIVIIRDFDDRVYVNGGDKKPLKLHLKLGSVDRDLEATLPIQVFYREKPPDPFFRFRLRFQFGLLVPTVISDFKSSLDAGLAYDFMHIDIFNFAIYTGVRSVGAGFGLDLTRNFGVFSNYALRYDELKHNGLVGVYFGF